MSVFVTKSFMPPIGEYESYIKKIYENGVLTNQGPLVRELDEKLASYLDVKNLMYVSNGTIALQLALKALDIEEGEIITTPFSYVATVSSILWERCVPVFVDVEKNNFTIDVDKIEQAITPKTRAILAVHVFGYACDVEKIQQLADKYGLKVIYDGAHCFGSKYMGKSLLSYGDVSTCSFHATKVFHTIEGGCCVVKNDDVAKKLDLSRRFGHTGDDHFCLGVNGKQSEFHAAMGLALFPYLAHVFERRKYISELYDSLLLGLVERPKKQDGLEYNYAYYPVLFKNEGELLKIFSILNQHDIFPRRYFYPSLNTLPYLKDKQSCPISEDICSRIACLPLYPELSGEIVEKICKVIKEVL